MQESDSSTLFPLRLLVDDDFRPSAATLKLDPWLSRQPFRNFASSPPAYIPPPFSAAQATASFLDSPNAQSYYAGSPASDMSSFFSSPGLSILRPSPPRGVQEEDTFWRGMSHLPAPEFFDDLCSTSTDTEAAGDPAPAGTGPSGLDAFRARQREFETPARPSRLTPRHSGSGQTPTSSGRARRMVSDMEAWREMQEHAYQAGLSARKQRSPTEAVRPRRAEGRREEGGPDELQSLERRQRGVLDELDGLEDKYRDLFSLAAKSR